MDIRISVLSILIITILGVVVIADRFPIIGRDPEPAPKVAPGVSVVPTHGITPQRYATPKTGASEDVFISTPEAIKVPDATIAREEPHTSTYVEVTGGCTPYWGGECLNVRSGPGTGHPSVLKLRNGTVLKSAGIVEGDGMRWHKIVFDEWVRYPERVSGEWYVAADFVRTIEDPGPLELIAGHATTTKRVLVDRSEQKLYAYDGDTLFMEESISTGLDLTPTPRGTFTVFRKTPSRYMQGPLPGVSDDVYDLPGVPWNLYFTAEGGAIHGTYWHENFGQQWSHGCVNLPPDKAQVLYAWAPVGTTVVVRD